MLFDAAENICNDWKQYIPHECILFGETMNVIFICFCWKIKYILPKMTKTMCEQAVYRIEFFFFMVCSFWQLLDIFDEMSNIALWWE